MLYDDGELTYSVDDHFDTIPQAVINLNNVFEITEADGITGNENSIAIVANDGIHFCKGTCREESRMWLDILRLFPQATVMGQGRGTGNGGRAKRSATFPGMRNLGTNFMSPASRYATNKAAIKAREEQEDDVEEDDEDEDDDEESQEDEEEPEEISKPLVEKPPLQKSLKLLSRRPSRVSGQECDSPPTPPEVSPPPSPSGRPPPSPSMTKTSTASISLINNSGSLTTSPSTTSGTPPYSRRVSYHRPTLSSEYRSTRFANDEAAASARRRISSSTSNVPSRGSQSCLGLAALQSRNLQKKDSISSTESLSPSPSESRGTPDGCHGLDHLIQNSPELLTKKGWLMKQGLTKEWHKYWFVLQDVALLYYRDPKAESKGFLDGIIDLSLVQGVDKTDLPRNFGFSVHTFEGKNIVFSAITDGIRNNWITCLRKAANLPDSGEKPALTKRSSSFSDAPMTITTTKIVRSSTSNVLIPPKVPDAAVHKSSSIIPKLTTTPSSSNEQDDLDNEDEDQDEDEESSDYEDEEEESEEIIDKVKEEVKTSTPIKDLSPVQATGSKYSFSSPSSQTINPGSTPKTSITPMNSSSTSNKNSSPGYDKSAYLEDELARVQKELAKQKSEIITLKNQLSLKQVIYSLIHQSST